MELVAADYAELLSAGEKLRSEAIVLPKVSGGRFSGAGNGLYKRHGLQGVATHIVREGESDDPMLVVQGNSWRLSDFSLQGRYKKTVKMDSFDQKETIPSAGILLRFASGAATGETIIDGVGFANVRAGVQFGERLNDSQCDNTTISHGYMNEVFACAEIVNQMGMKNTIQKYSITRARHGFSCLAAGHVTFDDCCISDLVESFAMFYMGPQLEIANAAGKTIAQSWGASNGYSLAVNVKTDSQCGPYFRYLEKIHDYDHACVIRDQQNSFTPPTAKIKKEFEAGGSFDTYLARVFGPGQLKIEGGSNAFCAKSLLAIHDPEKPAYMFTACGGPSFGDVKEHKDILHPASGPVRFNCDNSARAYGNTTPKTKAGYYISYGQRIPAEDRIFDGQGREYVENSDGTVKLKGE